MTVLGGPRLTPPLRLFGFLFGCVLSGGAVYSYVLNEYKTSNDLLTEDIYVRQSDACDVYTHALQMSLPIVLRPGKPG